MNSSKYPFENIYKIASLSGRRGMEIAKQQIEAIESPQKVIRYWAVMGLRSQPPAVIQTYREEIEVMIDDPYLPAAITASTIAYSEFGSSEAESKLIDALSGDNAELLLLTVNHLLYIKNKAPFMKAIKEVLARKDISYKVLTACKDFLKITNHSSY